MTRLCCKNCAQRECDYFPTPERYAEGRLAMGNGVWGADMDDCEDYPGCLGFVEASEPTLYEEEEA